MRAEEKMYKLEKELQQERDKRKQLIDEIENSGAWFYDDHESVIGRKDIKEILSKYKLEEEEGE